MTANFTMTGRFEIAQSDGADIGSDVDMVGLKGTVLARPSTKDKRPLAVAPNVDPPTVYAQPSVPFVGHVVNGDMEVRLPANDPLLGLEELWYEVTFDLFTPGGQRVPMETQYCLAPTTDVVVDLSTVLVSTQHDSKSVTRIAPGAVRWVDGNKIQFSFGGVDIPDPLELDLFWAPTAPEDPRIIPIEKFGGGPDKSISVNNAALLAAYAELGSSPGIIRFGVGTYLLSQGLNEAQGRLMRPGQGVVGAGSGQTIIDYRGPGFFVEARNDNFAATSSKPAGTVGGMQIWGWSNTNADAGGFRYGDIWRPRTFDLEISGFYRTGQIGLWGDNHTHWSERANIEAVVNQCHQCFVFESSTGDPNSGSFDYGTYNLSFVANPNQDALVLRSVGAGSKLSMNGVTVTLTGNCKLAEPGGTNTGALLRIPTNADPARFSGTLNIGVETSGTAGGVAHYDFVQGDGPFYEVQSRIIAGGAINLIPFSGTNFRAGTATQRTFAFGGLLRGSPSLGGSSTVQAFKALQLIPDSRGSWFLDKTNALQTVYVTNASGGTWSLGSVTGLAYNASVAQVQTAANTVYGAGNVVVTQGQPRFVNSVALNELAYVFRFGGALQSTDVPLITVNGSGLTGSSPSVTAVMKAPGSVNDTYVLYLEGGSIFKLEPPPGTYRTRIDLGGLTQYGSPLFGGDSSHGVNTVDVWIKQPDTGGPAVFEGPFFVPSFNSGASYTFAWKDGQTPTLSTVPGAIDVIKLSSANFSNWVGEHYTAPSSTSWASIFGKPAVIAAGATQAEARAAIGAGTSNLALGTTSTTAKAGNYTPTSSEITTALGYTPGTSSLVIGTTSTTAKAGNYTPKAETIGKMYVPPSTYVSGQWYFFNSVSSTSTAQTGNGNLRLSKCVIDTAVTIQRVLAEHTVAGEAGSVFRIGIYADDGTGWWPDALVLDAGTIATSGSPDRQEVTVSVTLQPGVYWVGGAVQNAPTTGPTMRAINGGQAEDHKLPFGSSLPPTGAVKCSVAKTGVTGALPANFGTYPTGSGVSTSGSYPARIGFKVA